MKNTSKMLIALGAGFAIGGVLGILFAPDKGKETRHKIAEGGKKFKNKFGEKVKMGKDRMHEQLHRMNEQVEELV